MHQRHLVEAGAEVLMALPQADVLIRGTIVRVEQDELPHARWFTVWTEAFGGFAVTLFERDDCYRVVDRPRSPREAVRRVMKCRQQADQAGRDDKETSS